MREGNETKGGETPLGLGLLQALVLVLILEAISAEAEVTAARFPSQTSCDGRSRRGITGSRPDHVGLGAPATGVAGGVPPALRRRDLQLGRAPRWVGRYVDLDGELLVLLVSVPSTDFGVLFSRPILEAPKETPPKITTPFDRDTWKVIEERKEASASDLRDAVEEASTQVAGVTRVSLDED